MLPDLVPREDLPAAVALGSAQWNLGRVIGPALAGIVITIGGFAWAFAINTVSFLAVIAAIAPLELPPPRPARVSRSRPRSARASASRATEPGLRSVIGYLCAQLVPRRAVHRARPRHGAEGVPRGRVGDRGARHRAGHRRGDDGALARRRRRAVREPPGAADGAHRSPDRARRCTRCAPTLWLAVIAIFFVGLLYLGCLSSFTTIAQLRAPGGDPRSRAQRAHGDPRHALPARRILQGASPTTSACA